MSRPAPSKNQQVIQFLLFAMMAWLALQLYKTSQQPKGPTPTIDQLRTQLWQDDAKIDQQSILSVAKDYESDVDDQLKDKKIDKATADSLKFQAQILVGDSQLKAAIHQDNANLYMEAYSTLDNLRKKYENTPLWTTSVDVPDVSDKAEYGWHSHTGQEIYRRTVDLYSAHNKTALVWGLIPGYKFIDFLVGLTGRVPTFSYAAAGILLALIVRIGIWPLYLKQIGNARQMALLMPMLKEIREKYKNPQEQQAKTMELYKEYGLNPLAGCFPLLIQSPIFIALYECMLQYRFEFQKGTFLWINPVTSVHTHGFTAPNLGQTDYALLIAYGVTMITSSLLAPVTDPTQKTQQKLIGVGGGLVFTIAMFFGIFPVPAAFVLYWTTTNILASLQSIHAYRQPVPPLVKVNAPGGGLFPLGPAPSANGAPKALISNNKTGTPVRHKPKKRK